MGLTVVGNPAAIVMTSSPGNIRLSPNTGDVNAMNASRFALEPELHRWQYLMPKNALSLFSNSSEYLPAVSQHR